MKLIELKDVRKQRGAGRQAVAALRGVSLEVRAGELVLVEGPSGAGKTTLLAVMAGLLAADQGEVILGGEALHLCSRAVRRQLRARKVGFIFQRPCLLDQLTVRDNLLLQATLAGVAAAEAATRADSLLERLGIGALGSRHPGQLSGGEEQRAAVARALVHRPALVLADEPTASLDRGAGGRVAQALAELAAEQEVAVVLATHDHRLRRLGSRRIWMEDGRLLAHGEEGTK